MSDDPIFFNTDSEMPTRADALQNRADILKVARDLFEQCGIEKVSMSQIAREAEVGKGTLYRHFRNKPDLCIALLDSDQRGLQDRTIHYMRSSTEAPTSKLLWFVERLCEFTERNLDVLYEARAGRLVDATVTLDHPAHHWQWQTIVGLIRQINPSIDAEYCADVIYVMLDAGTYHFQRYVRGYTQDRILSGVIVCVQQLLATP